MFQCLGLGTIEEGGCGEDWWHPECVVGLDREAYLKSLEESSPAKLDRPPPNGTSVAMDVILEEEPANGITEVAVPVVQTSIPAGVDGNDIAADGGDKAVEDDDPPLPPGFPKEDDFETFICYKCVEAFPWIRRYAGTPGFLPAVYFKPEDSVKPSEENATVPEPIPTIGEPASNKRKASDDENETEAEPSMAPPKRQKSEALPEATPTITTLPLTPKKPSTTSKCHVDTLPPAPEARFSLFMQPDFRDHLCRCPACFPLLKRHPQLLEDEDTYEPPMSEDGDNEGGASVGTGSILDRGEAVFNNMDRVKAIGKQTPLSSLLVESDY
jgi:E3 ubiquitin-protein ligase UBR7